VLVEATALPNRLGKRETQFWLAIDVAWPTESPNACTPVAFQTMVAQGDSNFDVPASWAFVSAIGTHTSCTWLATTTFDGVPPTATATLTCPDEPQPISCQPISENPVPGCIKAILADFGSDLLTPLNECQFP